MRGVLPLDAEERGVVVVGVAPRRGRSAPAVGQLGAERGRREPAELGVALQVGVGLGVELELEVRVRVRVMVRVGVRVRVRVRVTCSPKPR